MPCHVLDRHASHAQPSGPDRVAGGLGWPGGSLAVDLSSLASGNLHQDVRISPDVADPPSPCSASSATSSGCGCERLGKFELGIRRAAAVFRAPETAHIAFGAAWLLACGTLNAMTVHHDLRSYVFPEERNAVVQTTAHQQLLGGILVALQAVLLLAFFMGVSSQKTRWILSRRFMLLQGLLWLLRPLAAVTPGLSSHSHMILSSELSIVSTPAARLLFQIQAWSCPPFTGNAADFALLAMLWQQLQESWTSRAFMWASAGLGVAGLICTHSDHKVDVYLETLLGLFVCQVYHSYVERTVWSLKTEGPAAVKNRGWFKPFVCWYEGIQTQADLLVVSPKRYRVIPFNASRDLMQRW